ncbi:short-chain specific acyl-CoA dehydrogenase, mitochondrial-like isoform X1 [Danaus plexippus]|uniref:Short-chain specific acyl-CoA dehydrogenase, mitochondrial n=2 Tax=Danaus plexippus TaxID=13037 RepID=A0A212EI46_DANPL|nr:short-chain specific acyl-CoA dehydrogenase, mitochondrial-like isoform X1 [Danaus plexippus]OWR41141.1 putative Short-chain specific acyl-CoA dehydrogenase [Danaus plexippus plexippus]
MVAGAILKTTKLNSNLLQCVKFVAQSRSFTTQLTEQQLEIQELTRNFSENQLKPKAAKLDSEGRFPFSEIKSLTNLGLMGACVDQSYGGLDLDYLSLAIAVEEISRGCASTGMILSIHNFLYANLVNEKGTPEQKERFLCDFTKGSLGCFALSEPNAGSDVANIRTRARKDGDYWILNGKKSWVSTAVEGSAAAVFATFDPELRHKGLACFLVPLDAEGVFRGKKEPLMGVRAVTACDLMLEEVRLPSSCLLGREGEGFKIAMEQLDQGRIGIAAHAVGIAQSALDTAISYAKERHAFGKNLTRLPSVKDRLTDMCMLVETARLLTYRAACDVSTKNSAMAKYVAGRAATAASDHCVQVLGGRGLSTHYSAERHYRDARGTQIYGGVTDIQKRLVGHYLLKEHNAL